MLSGELSYTGKRKEAENSFRTKPLLEYMKAVPDPGYGRATKHNLAEILVCLVCGFIAGKTTIRRSLKWCKRHLDECKKASCVKERDRLPINGKSCPVMD